MALDGEAGLLFSDLARKQGARYIHIHQVTAERAMHVIVPISAAIETACLVTERELQDDAMLGEQMECPVDCSVCHGRVLLTHALENLAGRHVTACLTHFLENRQPLWSQSDTTRKLTRRVTGCWIYLHLETYFQLRMTTIDALKP